MNANETNEAAHRTRRWTSQPATERQLAYLPAHAHGANRYQASCCLVRRFNRRTIERLLAGTVEVVVA